MPITCDQRYRIGTGETEYVRVDFTSKLDSDESLAGTPTVVEPTTSGLSLSNKAVNAAAYIDNDGESIAIGKAIVFSVSGGTAGALSRVRVTCSSSLRTVQRDVLIEWV